MTVAAGTGSGSSSEGAEPARLPPVLAIAVAAVVALLGSLDSALNIAFPDLSDDFGLDVASIQWVVIAYVATYAALLIAAGRVADLIGYRTMLLWGLAISAVAFTATSVAPNYGTLLAARVTQGVGVAMLLAAAPALVTLAVAPERRGRALGIFQMSAALGLATGPLVGGLLVAGFGWRSVFWFRLPLCLVVLVAVARFLPAGRGGGAGAVRLDFGPFRRLGFVLANALNLISNATMFGIWLLLPYFAVDVLDTGAIVGGLLLTVVPLVQAASAPIAGWLSDRASPGWVTSAGLLIESAGLGALARFDAATTPPVVAAVLVGIGIGLSLFTVPNMSYVMGSIDRAHQGVAGGLTQMMRTTGVVVGVFVAAAYFNQRRAHHAEVLGVDLDGTVSFVPAFQDTFTLAALICGAAALISVARAATTAGAGSSA